MINKKLVGTSLLAAALLTINGCALTSNKIKLKPANGVRVAPAEYAKFQPILSASKLQISEPNAKAGSKTELALDSNFTGLVNEHFYVDQGSEAFVFNMEGYKLRNELRVMDNFNTSLPNTYYRLSADLMPINPRESVKNSEPKRDEMTFLQVHNSGTKNVRGLSVEGYIPHPLLRVVYDADRSGMQDHYWAVIKNNAVNCGSKSGNKGTAPCKKAYKRFDLGPVNPEAPTHFDIIVGNQKLVIKVDGEVKVDHDISYWKHLFSYFKAGVYNQFKNGKSEAHFYTLDYAVEEGGSGGSQGNDDAFIEDDDDWDF